ncbi:MAG: HEAT repeat domain-containing protein [Candidatus Poribacteria bacterium]|nr:HEAT repeat domain-containing protein [Candidatus Poribacteria bacterium]
MERKILLSISLVLIIGLLTGCAEKEDKNILEARDAIASANYTAAQSAVQTALANKPNLPEAQSLQQVLQLRTASGWKTEATHWQAAIQKVQDYLQPLNEAIKTLEAQEDPDSDDLDRLERLIRSRNSITGFLATSLAEAADKNATLVSDVVNQTGSAAITLLLEAEKCFNPTGRQAAAALIQSLGNTSSVSNLLIEATQHPDAAIRRQAVQHLGNLEDPHLIPVFESILKNKDESPDILYNVITALERLKYEPIIPALKLATQTNAAQARRHAAKLIGQLKAKEAIADLISLLADSDSYVKKNAINALVQIGEPAINPLIEVLDSGARNILPDENLELMVVHQYIANAYIDATRLKNHRINTQAAAAQALGGLKATEAISWLLNLLEDHDLRDKAVAALIAMKGVAVPDLIRALKDPRDDIRIQSAVVLNGIGDLRAVEALSETLVNDSRKEVKATAAKALSTMKGPGKDDIALNSLTQALDLDDTTAANAATALGEIQIGTDRAIGKLIALAMDKRGRETVRSAALSALAKLKPTQAVQPMLLLMLSDETSPALRKGAATVLGEVKAKESVPVLLWVLGTRYEDIKDFQRYMKRGYKTLGGLKDAMNSLGIEWTPEYSQPVYRTWGELKPIPSLVRSEVALALGKIKGDEVVKPLLDALKDDERAAVRKSAAFALGEIKGEAVVDPLIQALKKDKQGIVRQEAAVALGKVAGEKVVAPLLTALKKDKFEATRKKAAIALRELKQELADHGLVDVLKKGLGTFEERQEVESVQTEVMLSLNVQGNTITAKFIRDALRSTDDEWARWALVKTLASLDEHKDKSFQDVFVAELERPSYVVRKAAVSGLGAYKDRQSFDALVQVLQNLNEYKSIRAAAAAALGVLLDERAADPLLAALDDDKAEVRLHAATALGAIKSAKAVDKLIELLQNPLEDVLVRAACVTALGSIGGEQAEAVLLKTLRTETGDIYKNAITALGTLKSTKAVPELIAIFEDQSIELDASTEATAKLSARTKAAAALAEIEDQRAAEAIGKRLIDQTEYIVAVKDKLGKKIDKRNWSWEQFVAAARPFQLPDLVAPKMIERIESPRTDWPVKAAAADALGGCRTPEAAAKLKELLVDPKVEIRREAARSIGRAKFSQFKADIIKMMKGETEANKDVRRWATQGVGELAEPSTVPDLVETLNNDANHEEIRRDAAIALGKIGNDAAVSALVEKLQTLQASQAAKKLRVDIIKGLAEAKHRKAVPILETALEDVDGDIHFWAADALFQITGDGRGYHRVG